MEAGQCRGVLVLDAPDGCQLGPDNGQVAPDNPDPGGGCFGLAGAGPGFQPVKSHLQGPDLAVNVCHGPQVTERR